jgi:hypothetical protein
MVAKGYTSWSVLSLRKQAVIAEWQREVRSPSALKQYPLEDPLLYVLVGAHEAAATRVRAKNVTVGIMFGHSAATVP